MYIFPDERGGQRTDADSLFLQDPVAISASMTEGDVERTNISNKQRGDEELLAASIRDLDRASDATNPPENVTISTGGACLLFCF
jgi:hypothetical protein